MSRVSVWNRIPELKRVSYPLSFTGDAIRLHKFSLDQSADSKILRVGVGLMSTWKSDTNHPIWIGYQVI